MPTKFPIGISRTDSGLIWNLTDGPGAVRCDPAQNPRTDLGDTSELEAQIEAQGMLVPMIVRADPTRPDGWLLVAGYRRYAAVHALRARGVDVRRVRLDYRGTISDEAALVIALTENARENLPLSDEARSVERLVGYGWTQDEIAAKLGRSQAWVSRMLRIASTPRATQKAIDAGDKAAKREATAPRAPRRLSRHVVQEHLKERGQPVTDYDQGYAAALLWCLEKECSGLEVAP